MQTSPRTGSLEAQPEAFERHSRTPLIVFSHLRWGFVFQRPQHLLTRLARQYDVMFIEEPVFADGEPALMSATRQEGVEVLTPRTNVVVPGFNDEQMPVLRRLVAEFVASRGLSDPLVWLYTPMALPLVADLDPLALVYDCMDDLASFKFAPPQLVEREAALMRMADVVLTGGPSLYEARKGRHPNLHCLPSAVDARHFSAAELDLDAPESAAARALHAGLAHPRLGFFGVIDERLDLELVVGIAERRPDWQIVMVGPVVKIDPATLPRRPNIRWLGMQGYEALPHLTAQWDVCLLPFALNEATRFISPTKTLEYLAAGKPVVSTPIRDVVSLYGAAVRIGSDADEFVAAVEAALGESEAETADWHVRAQAMVDSCTWDGTAEIVAGLLGRFLPAMPAAPILLSEPLADVAARVAARDDGAQAVGPVVATAAAGEREEPSVRPLAA
jgi:glycosyltransferase involved in cell wall biosynthesis